MSLAVVSTLWMDIYSPEGILNTLLAHLGISAQPFIHSAKQALPSIAVMSVWQGVGYQMIIFSVSARGGSLGAWRLEPRPCLVTPESTAFGRESDR